MKKLKIINIDEKNYKYYLEDEKKRKYIIMIQFFDIEPLPQIGENLYFTEKLFNLELNEGVLHFMFGGIYEPYGKEIKIENIEENIEEILMIERKNKNIYLKRFYG